MSKRRATPPSKHQLKITATHLQQTTPKERDTSLHTTTATHCNARLRHDCNTLQHETATQLQHTISKSSDFALLSPRKNCKKLHDKTQHKCNTQRQRWGTPLSTQQLQHTATRDCNTTATHHIKVDRLCPPLSAQELPKSALQMQPNCNTTATHHVKRERRISPNND